jgi:O-antigen ligase
MEHAVSTTRAHRVEGPLRRVDLRATGAWGLACLLVVYLGLRGGGYDPLVRGEIGVAVWWVVLLGVATGVLPLIRVQRSAWIAIGLFAAFAVWTALGISWSTSAERSTAELARVATYGGVLVLGVMVFSRRTARHGLNGVATGIAVVAGLAVASRLHPSAFPADQVPEFLGTTSKRLNYPLNYADGLASFLALGLPVLLGVAGSARTIAGRALAAGALPVVVLGMFLTDSRGGVLALIFGLVAFYALVPDRLPKLVTALVAGAGSAILVAAVTDRADLQNGLGTALAHRQGDELIGFVLVTIAGVALIQAAIALVDRHVERPAWMVVPRRRAAIAAGVALALAVVVAVAVGVPGKLSDQWDSFKQPEAAPAAANATNVFDRLQNLSGSRRYQYWNVAWDAFESEPVHGIGPGTFEFRWLEHGRPYEFVRNAHSLFLETLAELGIVGLLLLLGLLGWLVAVIGRAALSSRGDPGRRVIAATCAAGVLAFCGGALVNWTWQIGVIPITTLLLAAVGLAVARTGRSGRRSRRATAPPVRIAFGVLAAVALVAIAIPLSATDALRTSQADARGNNLAGALSRANDALAMQPYAATPRLQRGLVLEAAGRFAPAAAAVRGAIAREPDNWRLWLVLSRIEGKAVHPHAAVQAYLKARSLNPGSPIFAAR